ncbi:TetR family transcriptional regulator [Streptomyces venezuelae]|uniref:TetR/AcrR family transcriptional regulator n=1 Tax=Streptomyces gardneri TaxID=66892 RepID=UPI0006BCEB78|nr:TetR/AcrR family transcriptional regulator [Streptomyces gardneri]ALO13301.1 TetR family transcriptional regulator [Streptomyces venezuelae]QPK49953.1 TetR/AcrR family transcriptional regulator [Streptomyces gardneri]WRK41526.1 TetR/AcrR family transcriptional regulator [Streptomyces venezuelae]CUM36006.1 probable transcriptional regulator, TetR family [Streptomyces venezuelae]
MGERAGGKGRGGAGRTPLSRERVIRTAVAVADEKGSAALSMRAIAAPLGVEAMSLYHHVAGRDDILDGMVDAVFGEIDLPSYDTDWKSAMRARARSARAALLRHPWAIGLMDSRSRPGPATLRHHDAVIGVLRTAGFSVPMTAHAVSLIDSYLYGFVLQEVSLPFSGSAELDEVAGAILHDMPADTYPHLTELATQHVLTPGYDYADEFAFGLARVLDALHPDEVP